MRRSIGACEKYHGAVIDHAGTKNTRVYREVAALGRELSAIGNRFLGVRTRSEIAVLIDWDNWWAIEYSAGPNCDLHYLDEISRYYDALRELNYSVDIISPDMDFAAYKVVIAPVFYMVKGNTDEKVRVFVKGGTALAEVLFGKVNPSGKLAETIPQMLEMTPVSVLGSHVGNPPSEQEQRKTGVRLQQIYTEGVFVEYRYYEKYQVPVQFCFGHGLSYTQYTYGVVCAKWERDAAGSSVEDIRGEVEVGIETSW